MLDGSEKFSLPKLEEEVLNFWKKNRVFEKSLKKKKAKFVFYEGPPTANGRPGIHHVLGRAFKDIVLRYKTMRGFSVPRRGGWDTHGLPVELEMEKSLGLKSKKDIEKYGVAEFNRKCRESVWRYKDEWEKLTERMGFWIDLEDPYITYENAYIESLWRIIKQIADQKLLHKGHKIVQWCTRCETALSSHEMALGYETVTDTSVTVKFRIRKPTSKLGTPKDKPVHILSWTTTPWTLPGNIALAVGEKIKYVIFKVGDGLDLYVAAKERIKYLADDHDIIGEISGKDLVGLEYEPIFDIKKLKNKNSYKVYPADFVTTEEGTGVVHTAVMYGEDDYNLGIKVGLPQHHTVDENGKFTKDVTGLVGLYVRSKEAEEKIIGHLKGRDLLFKSEDYAHDYPFCWRCSTPLLYYARNSWFIKISILRDKLSKANSEVNWIPSHIKEGRFGEWLRGAKDWNFSRERYWGTPFPVWECSGCGKVKVIGSRDEIIKNRAGSANKYILIRHGEGENNVKKIINSWPEKEKLSLTARGRMEVDKAAQRLKKKGVDLVFASDITRTKETAEIIAANLGKKKINFDARIREINMGIFNGQGYGEDDSFYSSYWERFRRRPPEGESLSDVRKRVFEFFKSLEKKYKNKTIVVVSHEYPLWMMEMVLNGWDEKEAIEEKKARGDDFFSFAETRELEFKKLPRDESGQADFHKPYIDEVVFDCRKCKGKMKRVPDVIDVWFDSGAMPFASNKIFREQIGKSKSETKKLSDFPADFITEGIDQTRGWFYTLLAVSVLMGHKSPYRNVISFGLILDKQGRKMSKSKGNVVDPWDMMEKHGIDAVRWYFYTTNQPGEPKRFDEEDLRKINRQFINIIYNSYIFYKTYADKKAKNGKKPKAKNLLDKWIIAELNKLIDSVTKDLEEYDITGAGRRIEKFVDDLSRWYIRRSRRRFSAAAKEGFSGKAKSEHEEASQVLGYTLTSLSKVFAPFVPFFAEGLYKSLASRESVHLEDWPEADKKAIDKGLIDNMENVRRLASLALARRSAAGIKVRQPLSKLTIKDHKIGKNKELMDILKEEINVKEIAVREDLKEEIELDTNLTHELKEEGWFREFVRIVQGMRQDGNLEPKDKIVLMVVSSDEINYVLEKNGVSLRKEVGAKSVEFHKSEKFQIELETKIENHPLWVGVRRI